MNIPIYSSVCLIYLVPIYLYIGEYKHPVYEYTHLLLSMLDITVPYILSVYQFVKRRGGIKPNHKDPIRPVSGPFKVQLKTLV